MRFNNLLARALSAVLVTVLLNGSVVAAFAHVATARGAAVPYDTRILA
jgi:hypothetical protein